MTWFELPKYLWERQKKINCVQQMEMAFEWWLIYRLICHGPITGERLPRVRNPRNRSISVFIFDIFYRMCYSILFIHLNELLQSFRKAFSFFWLFFCFIVWTFCWREAQTQLVNGPARISAADIHFFEKHFKEVIQVFVKNWHIKGTGKKCFSS